MKKLSAGLCAIALILAGCGASSQPAPEPQANNPFLDDAGRNYERYEGNIWAEEPFQCGGDIICLTKRAETCTPSKGRFIAEYRDRGHLIRETYEIGVQGRQFGDCQMYFKVADYLVNSVQRNPGNMPLGDPSTINYQACRFAEGNDIADLLRQGPKDAGSNTLGNGYLDPTGLFSTKFDKNGTKNPATYVEVAKRCFTHTYPDSASKITSVRYELVAGEAIEDASQDFRLTVTNIDAANSSMTAEIRKGNRTESVTVTGQEEKTAMDYKLKIDERGFGEKNVARNSEINIMEPTVKFIVSID